jgi:hypothetical protein
MMALLSTAFLIIILFFGAMVSERDTPEPEPVEELPTVTVRIVDKNKVIHSREGMLLDGVVTVELSGK